MGVGHLDIGENIGDAKVFNPMPAIQQYGQILQQRQEKHENEVKQLADSLAKGYDPSGLRNDADRSAYIKQYNDVKDFAIDAENEKDATKKAMKLAQVKQKLNDLGAFAEGSKNYYKNVEQPIGKLHAENEWAVDNATSKRLSDGRGRVWNDPNNIKGIEDVVRGVDPAKADAIFDKHVKDMVAPTKWDVYKGETETKPGNEGQWEYQKRGIPLHGDNGALESTLNLASAYPDFKKSLYDRYPDAQYPDMASKAMQYLQDKGKGDGFWETGKQTFKPAKETDDQKFAAATRLHDANRQYDIHNPPALTPYQRIEIDHWTQEHGGGQTGVPQPMNIPFGGKPGTFVNSPNYIPVSLAKKNFAGAPAIVMSTGKPIESLASSDDYSMIGAGDFPILNDKTNIPGSLSQPDFAKNNPDKVTYQRMIHVKQVVDGDTHDYLVPYNTLPKNVANQKAVKTALAPLDKMPVYGQKSGQVIGDKQPKQNTKQPAQLKSQVDVDKLPKGTHFIWSDGKEYVK